MSFGPEDFAAATGVARATVSRLKIFADLITRRQSTLNLISTSSMSELWQRHMLDSAQVYGLAPDTALRWADLGTGAGFPGMVVALLGASRPGFEVHLVEKLQAKCVFLQEVAAATGAPVVIHKGRAEALAPLGADVVTARALAPLDRLFGYYLRHKSEEGCALFPKGRSALQELTQARASWTLELDLVPSRTSPEGRILRIRSAEPKKDGRASR